MSIERRKGVSRAAPRGKDRERELTLHLVILAEGPLGRLGTSAHDAREESPFFVQFGPLFLRAPPCGLRRGKVGAMGVLAHSRSGATGPLSGSVVAPNKASSLNAELSGFISAA